MTESASCSPLPCVGTPLVVPRWGWGGGSALPKIRFCPPPPIRPEPRKTRGGEQYMVGPQITIWNNRCFDRRLLFGITIVIDCFQYRKDVLSFVVLVNHKYLLQERKKC